MTDWLATRFEENRSHLRSVAYRMLGSLDDADDAVQEAWLRLSQRENGGIENLGGWLTTVVARICVDMLRARRAKREETLPPSIPDFIVSREESPEEEALTADSVGLALLVVLDSLTPSERLAFVLHDMFAMPLKRSHRSSDGRRPPPVSSPAAHAAECRERRRHRPAWRSGVRSLMRSSRRLAKATSRRLWRCSILTFCCSPIANQRRRGFAAQRRSLHRR